jgi:hypothetical protein
MLPRGNGTFASASRAPHRSTEHQQSAIPKSVPLSLFAVQYERGCGLTAKKTLSADVQVEKMAAILFHQKGA